MKIFLFALTLAFIFSCSGEKLKMNEAIKTAEIAIQLIGSEKYKELSDLYTSDFKEGESAEVKEKKFTQIISIIGKTESYNLTDSNRVNTDDANRIVLKYNVKHSKATTTETYTISKEEGNYRIAGIYITNK